MENEDDASEREASPQNVDNNDRDVSEEAKSLSGQEEDDNNSDDRNDQERLAEEMRAAVKTPDQVDEDIFDHVENTEDADAEVEVEAESAESERIPASASVPEVEVLTRTRFDGVQVQFVSRDVQTVTVEELEQLFTEASPSPRKEGAFLYLNLTGDEIN